MTTKDTIIWIGTIADNESVLHSAAGSPAANRWQSGFLSALVDQGLRICVLSHWPEPLFPRGPVFVSAESCVQHGINSTSIEQSWISYVNVPLVRPLSLVSGYKELARRIVADIGDRLAGVVSYNANDVGRAIKSIFLKGTNVPWVPIVADASGTPEGKRLLFDEVAEADTTIVLSWGLAQAWQGSPVMHLDGGITTQRLLQMAGPRDRFESFKDSFPFLYCGAINKWSGVDLLAEAFAGWSDPRPRLWICGKGARRERFPLLAKDARVVFFDAVTDNEFERLASQCYALVNPRPSGVVDNEMNFPSKVLEYLCFGKPVVSTWTAGLDPVYRSVLTVTLDDSPYALRCAMKETMTWDVERMQRNREVARDFLLKTRTWDLQALRVLELLNLCQKRSKQR